MAGSRPLVPMLRAPTGDRRVPTCPATHRKPPRTGIERDSHIDDLLVGTGEVVTEKFWYPSGLDARLARAFVREACEVPGLVARNVCASGDQMFGITDVAKRG